MEILDLLIVQVIKQNIVNIILKSIPKINVLNVNLDILEKQISLKLIIVMNMMKQLRNASYVCINMNQLMMNYLVLQQKYKDVKYMKKIQVNVLYVKINIIQIKIIINVKEVILKIVLSMIHMMRINVQYVIKVIY